ncbi:protein transport protein HofB [Citrobacter koseri]|uniref:Protein transport protein HofB n=1 Tax=Citrobacter koseri TaxID=545 RepID=A0A2X2VC08_CITKO|nr:protein transport protein HofB [Citrobacter koseri]
MNITQLTALCLRHQGILLDADNEVVHVAVVDSPSHELLDALHFATTKRDRHCLLDSSADGKAICISPGKCSRAVIADDSRTAAELLQQTLESALAKRASDIHIEPAENHYRIRLRVDGVLHALPGVSSVTGRDTDGKVKGTGQSGYCRTSTPARRAIYRDACGQCGFISCRGHPLPGR